jgi:hypothetical protein
MPQRQRLLILDYVRFNGRSLPIISKQSFIIESTKSAYIDLDHIYLADLRVLANSTKICDQKNNF